MKKILINIFFALPCLFSVASCDKDILMDAGEVPKLVAECILSTDQTQTLYLNLTKGASKTEAPEVKKAKAILIDLNESTTVGEFKKVSRGKWTLAYTPPPFRIIGTDWRSKFLTMV